jgi:hypothetical protein
MCQMVAELISKRNRECTLRRDTRKGREEVGRKGQERKGRDGKEKGGEVRWVGLSSGK